MVVFLNNYGLSCCDEGVVASLDNNNKYYFGVDIIHSLDDYFTYFLLSPPFEWILEVTLGGKCIVHHGYMKEGGWSETYFHFSNYHEHKNPTIYQYHLDYGRERGWYDTYIHLSHHHMFS